MYTIACVFQANAQAYKNSLNIELGGGGLAYSINYEHFFSKKFAPRIGMSFLHIRERQTEKSLVVMSFPVSLHYLQNIHNEAHFLEAGFGTMNLITTGDLVEYKGVTDIFLNPFIHLGYRYRPAQKRWNFLIGFTPFYGIKSITNPTEQGFRPFGSKVQLWGTIGVGYNF